MTSSCRTYSSVLIACVALYATGVTVTPAVSQTSIGSPESRVEELVRELANIKKSIRPRHCTDLLRGGQRTSGIYTIFPIEADPVGTLVYCDMEMEGGGWTVIQKRGQYGNSVFYFYRNWSEYAKGFGHPAKEYWIGNRVLHAMTSLPETMQLRVILRGNETTPVDYASMKVENETLYFKVKMGRFLRPLGWDALSYSNGARFSTFDRDHDSSYQNCAVKYRGAWWYNQCHRSNLNGLNLNGPHDSYADGIEWAFQGTAGVKYHYSYPSVQMMIRPATVYLDKYRKGG